MTAALEMLVSLRNEAFWSDPLTSMDYTSRRDATLAWLRWRELVDARRHSEAEAYRMDLPSWQTRAIDVIDRWSVVNRGPQ